MQNAGICNCPSGALFDHVSKVGFFFSKSALFLSKSSDFFFFLASLVAKILTALLRDPA